MIIHVTFFLSEQTRTFEFKGRLGRAVFQLAQAGTKGVTPFGRPAPCWSGYVHDLRGMGIPIETELISRVGMHPDPQARYRLSCDVDVTILGPQVVE